MWHSDLLGCGIDACSRPQSASKSVHGLAFPEICGKIFRRENNSDRDQVVGRFRIYYADFEVGQNHNVTAREILDTYQQTFDYADVVLNSDGTPFSRRLNNLL